MTDLSRGAQRLLALLESYARRSGRAFPFQKTLAAKMGYSEQMLRRYLLELKKSGFMQIKKRGQTSAEYFPQSRCENPAEKLRSELRSELRSAGPLIRNEYFELGVSAPSARAPLCKKPPQSETNADGWDSGAFKAALAGCALPENEHGSDVLSAARASGSTPERCAAVFSRLVREDRFRHASTGYFLGALRGELSRRAG